MEVLTGFQRDALYVIARLKESKGLAIKDELEYYYNTEVHHSTSHLAKFEGYSGAFRRPKADGICTETD